MVTGPSSINQVSSYLLSQGYLRRGHFIKNFSHSRADRFQSLVSGSAWAMEACNWASRYPFVFQQICIQLIAQLFFGQYRASKGTSPSSTMSASASKAPSSPSHHTPTSTTDAATTHSAMPKTTSARTSTTTNITSF